MSMLTYSQYRANVIASSDEFSEADIQEMYSYYTTSFYDKKLDNTQNDVILIK